MQASTDIENELLYTTRPHGDSTLGLIVNAAFSVVSLVVAVLLLPILVPTALLFRVWQTYLHEKVMLDTRRQATICEGLDSIWLTDSPENMAIINALLVLKGDPDMDKLKNLIAERFTYAKDETGERLFPKLTRYVQPRSGIPVWMEERFFDIDEHVILWTKTRPSTEQALNELVGFLCSQPLPEHLARWQCLIIPPMACGQTSEEERTHHVLLRVHHSVGDGVALVKALVKHLMDNAPEDKKIVPFGTKNKMWRAVKAVLTGPSILMERLYKPADSSVLHGPQPSGEKLVAWSKPIDLNIIKKMKNAVNMTVNDVLMGSLAGAFRDYFKAHASNIPQGIVASVPIDLRSPESKVVLDNQFGLVFLTLPTNIDDPFETLTETKQRMDFMKISGEPIVNALVTNYVLANLPQWLTKPVFDMQSDKCTMVLSNVPGPQHKLQIAGKPIESIVFWPPGRTTVALSVSILSYNGQVTMGVMADKCLLSNPSILVSGFCDKVNELARKLNVLTDDKKDTFFVPSDEE